MSNLSFLPEDYLERRAQRRTNFLCITLFLIVMAAVVGAFFVTDQQRQEVRHLRNDVNAQFIDAAERLEQLEQLREQKARMLRKAEVTGALVEKVPRRLIVSEIVNSMPDSVSLTQFAMETEDQKQDRPRTELEAQKNRRTLRSKAAAERLARADLAPEPVVKIKPTVTTLELAGLARTDVEVADFMTALRRSPLFTEVVLQEIKPIAESKRKDHGDLRVFKVGMQLNEKANVFEMKPKMVERLDRTDPMSPQRTSVAAPPDEAVATPASNPESRD